MKVYQYMFVALLALAVVGDIGHFISNLGASPGSEISRNSFSLISGSDAAIGALLGAIIRAINSRRAFLQKNKNKLRKHQRGTIKRKKDKKRPYKQKSSKKTKKSKKSKKSKKRGGKKGV